MRDSVRNTGMICLLDEGEYGNIHPVNKQPVGIRLAELAERLIYHGTGDVYASAFTGALLQGKTAQEAAVLAADFTVAAIRATVGDQSHPYGVKFEKVLSLLTDEFGKSV